MRKHPLFNVFLGSMLGDGHISRQIGNAHFVEGHACDQEEYLRWKMQFWTDVGVRVAWYYREPSKPTHQRSITASTQTLPALNQWHDLFYGWNHYSAKRKPKKFHPDLIPLISPLGLAVWYMDDGGAGHRPTFSVHPRSSKVAAAILHRFGLEHLTTINEEGTCQENIKLAILDHERFFDIVRPYIHPTLEYKLYPAVLGQAAFIPDDEFCVLVEQGLGLELLAEHFQTKTPTIKKKATSLGLTINGVHYTKPDLQHLVIKVPRQGRQGRNTLRLPEDPLMELHQRGTDAKDIARRFGVSAGLVRREIRRHKRPGP